jgi:polyribonucleotide nucleotidyltransferase
MENMKKHAIIVDIGTQQITFETGKIARQANGAVLVKAGETVVFSAACAAAEAAEGADFFPLRVDYLEHFSSVGKTVSGFIKRQGRPTEKEVLTSRLIDRPLRPMFEDGYFNEVQVLNYVWSYDGVNTPEPLAICAASAALAISDIPLLKPIAGVRVGMVQNQFVINPTIEQQKNSTLDLLLAGTESAVLMIEGYCSFLTEEQVLKAIEFGHQNIKKICHALADWQAQIGKPKHRGTLKSLPPELLKLVDTAATPLLDQALRIPEKLKRENALNAFNQHVETALSQESKEVVYEPSDVAGAIKKVQSNRMRRMIVQENLRSDGRDSVSIRSIDIEQSLLPRSHGSSLFTRGETQSLAVCTLGGESMAQRYEDLHGESSQRFYLQYFFPPFSVGEVGRMGSAGRREIGHGKLAERALLAALPSKQEFPYVIRVESNITESNGSSSMASVCGGCLALMDAGVPIKRPVAGIAMGLVLEGDKFTILSDILGIEDALGDMDFKVTGDHEGITAFQMDIKVEGITIDIMRAALAQAKEGRIHILRKMLDVCPKFREKMSIHAPRIENIQIKPSKIATVIGPGGKQIRAIIEATGVQIDIDDSGLVSIASSNLEGIEKAKAMINGLTAEVEIGRVYSGKITSIMPFGLFVEILPGKEGLCHISEFDKSRIENLSDYVKVGDTITVKVLDINERGQLKLSRKATMAA